VVVSPCGIVGGEAASTAVGLLHFGNMLPVRHVGEARRGASLRRRAIRNPAG
jgi:hypothetical protein